MQEQFRFLDMIELDPREYFQMPHLPVFLPERRCLVCRRDRCRTQACRINYHNAMFVRARPRG
jgi:hypothetical protein